MRVECPGCGRGGSVPEEFPRTRVIKCPACSKKFSLASLEIRHQPPAVAPQQVAVNVMASPPAKPGNPLAISGLVVGVISAAICWVPFLGMVAAPLGILAIVLSLVGAVLAFAWGRTGRSAAVGGLALGGGSMILAFMITGATVKRVDEVINAPANLATAAPDAEPPKIELEPVASKTEPEPDPEPSFVVAPNPARLGVVSVAIGSANITEVPLETMFGDRSLSEEPLLVLIVGATNTSESRKVSYRTWAGADFAMGQDFATLTDNFGNSYKRITFGSSSPLGRAKPGTSIYPGETATDVLVFETPVKGVESLTLEMPGRNVGEDGAYRFQIPAAMIKGL